MSAALRLLIAGFALLLGACSSYQGRWRAARDAAPGKDPLVGAYVGRWESSEYKGAGGKLWCILTKKSVREYNAQFRATWHSVFASEHDVTLKTSGSLRTKVWKEFAYTKPKLRDSRYHAFKGEAEIHMWIGSGTYRTEGRLYYPLMQDCTGQIMDQSSVITPAEMKASYDASYDKGTMTLEKAR